MSGGSAEHQAIISNINRELSLQLKNRPCYVYAQGMRLHVRAADAGKYPDLMARVVSSCSTTAAGICC